MFAQLAMVIITRFIIISSFVTSFQDSYPVHLHYLWPNRLQHLQDSILVSFNQSKLTFWKCYFIKCGINWCRELCLEKSVTKTWYEGITKCFFSFSKVLQLSEGIRPIKNGNKFSYKSAYIHVYSETMVVDDAC